MFTGVKGPSRTHRRFVVSHVGTPPRSPPPGRVQNTLRAQTGHAELQSATLPTSRPVGWRGQRVCRGVLGAHARGLHKRPQRSITRDEEARPLASCRGAGAHRAPRDHHGWARPAGRRRVHPLHVREARAADYACRDPGTAALRIAAFNHALEGLPPERTRYHICWGSWNGPHLFDVPLKDIVDLVLEANVGALSFEAANPRHEHEWRIWKDVCCRRARC